MCVFVFQGLLSTSNKLCKVLCIYTFKIELPYRLKDCLCGEYPGPRWETGMEEQGTHCPRAKSLLEKWGWDSLGLIVIYKVPKKAPGRFQENQISRSFILESNRRWTHWMYGIHLSLWLKEPKKKLRRQMKTRKTQGWYKDVMFEGTWDSGRSISSISWIESMRYPLSREKKQNRNGK